MLVCEYEKAQKRAWSVQFTRACVEAIQREVWINVDLPTKEKKMKRLCKFISKLQKNMNTVNVAMQRPIVIEEILMKTLYVHYLTKQIEKKSME